MSVIAGIVRFSGAPVSVDDLALAAARLAAPGVGEAVHWIKGSVGLVVRQRVVTNEDMFERQPWTNGRLVMVYDGRLDNRDEVAEALGISIKGSEVVPDGRLIFSALERWGQDAFPKFIGDFAVALWDTQNKRLILARDHIGNRTLYYHHGSGFIAFASTYSALLALPGVPKKINELCAADYLFQIVNHPIETFYEGILRVPSASLAIFNENSLHIGCYWDPTPKSQIRFSSDGEYVEAAREQLGRAVACRLRSKEPVASLMTGGLDSSAVAATAARLLAPNRLLTVTAVPPEEMVFSAPSSAFYIDERPYVKAIADMHSNMKLVLTSSKDPHWLDKDPSPFFNAGGVPAINITHAGWFMPGYEMIVKARHTVLLTGDYGNAVWSWDGLRSLNDMFRQGNWFRLARELSLINEFRQYDFGWKKVLRSEIISPLMPARIKMWRRSLRTDDKGILENSVINREFARELNVLERLNHSLNNTIHGQSGGLKLRHGFFSQREKGRDMYTALRSLTGIESRAPLMDVRLVEFCLAIPSDQYLRDGVARRLPRLAMADRLPTAVLENNRIGAQIPEKRNRVEATRAGLIEEIESFERVPLAVRYIDLQKLKNIVHDWPLDDFQVTFVLPRALTLARFLRWAETGL
jgi:asparagine synthase (glutamine-hydrolysing)